ncbi:hypothetical protein QAD02_018222 [Eretmocerus hayati]|uniref:Uncharacterized protein n=1 Tax=Eretmocerus hayati TaxID=131215 RepID=A0ACC2PG82_9HYME|nr:hypothetical protein QAD02_018222 [Eretmocerus hayati]
MKASNFAVLALALIAVGVNAQNDAGIAQDVSNVGSAPVIPEGTGNMEQSLVTSPAEAPVIQAPVVHEMPTDLSVNPSAPVTTDSILSDLWAFIEEVTKGNTIPDAFIRMEMKRINRNLYSVFGYKIVRLRDCPEAKDKDLGTPFYTTLQDIFTQKMDVDSAVKNGLLRLRNQGLKRFGLMVVGKDECPNAVY